jgi:hypothetical protein
MNSQMQSLFRFEEDFEDSLRCIPMSVRLKLDTCGIKLKLAHWLNLSHTQRSALLDCPCDSSAEIQAYRLLIHQFTAPNLPLDLLIEPNPAWLELNSLPKVLQQKLIQMEREVSLSQWQQLSPLQRFALIKLSGDRGGQNFTAALQEFGII